MERKIGKSLGFVFVTVVLILITVFCSVQTVRSQTNIGAVELENYYLEKEKELVKETREFLNENGFRDSGVTLTRVVDSEGQREYTIMIHHGKINKMQEEARESLRLKLAEVTFEADNCSFYHEFLVTQ